MTFAQRFGRGLVWNQLGRAVELGAAYATSVVAARALGPVAFGVYSIALSAVTLSYYASSLGMNEVLNVHVPRLRDQPGRVAFVLRALLRLRMIVALLVGAALTLGAPLLARVWREPALEPLLRIAGMYAFFTQISLLLEYFFVGSLEVPRVARVRVFVQLLGLAAAAAALAWHWPASRLLLAFAINAALGVLALVWAARRTLRTPGEPFDLVTLRSFGLTIWASNFVTFFLGRQSDVLLVGLFRPGTSEAGCYAAAALLATLLSSGLLMGAEGVSLAAFSELESRVDRGGLGRLWSLHLKMDVLLSLPLLAFGAAYAREIVAVLYAEGFAPAADMLVLYCGVWVIVRVLGGGTNMTVLYSINDPRTPLIIYGVSGIANLVLNLILVPRFGGTGAVFGTGIALIGSSLASGLLVHRHTGTPFPLGFALKVALASLAALLATHWLPRLPGLAGLALAGAVGLVICLVALRLLRPLADDDRRLLARLNPRLEWLAARL